MPELRVDPASFESIYATADDPWAFASSVYELAKYDTTMDALSKPRYRRCFEPACSIGVLTERLAGRADHVVACDGSALAAERARSRLREAGNVDIVTASIPEWWPDGTFDLIVLSELGYYWDRPGWGRIVDRARNSLGEGGEVVAVHWLGASPDHILDGRTVHDELGDRLGPSGLHLVRPAVPDDPAAPDGFVLDRWGGSPGSSIPAARSVELVQAAQGQSEPDDQDEAGGDEGHDRAPALGGRADPARRSTGGPAFEAVSHPNQ